MKKIIMLILALTLFAGFLTGCKKDAIDNDTAEENVQTNISSEPQNESDEKNDEDKQSGKDESQQKEDNSVVDKDKSEEPTKNPNSTEKPVVQENSKEYTASSLVKEMLTVLPENSMVLEELPSDLYSAVYGIEVPDFKEVSVYGSMIGTMANEVIAIKVKNSSEISNAQKVLNNRKDTLYKQYEKYLPDQFEIVKKAVVKTKGDYVILIVSPSVEMLSNKFDILIK